MEALWDFMEDFNDTYMDSYSEGSSPSSPSVPASPGSNYSDIENQPTVYKTRTRIIGGKRVQQRYAANQRERKRMRSINDAFEGLRTRIPLARGDKKLSKVDTLRSAIQYIHHLSQVLQSCGSDPENQDHKQQKKIIIKCHMPDYPDAPLYGHSLSWKNDNEPVYGPNNTLTAKIWMPESPSGDSELTDS